jgi:hypothetical protein
MNSKRRLLVILVGSVLIALLGVFLYLRLGLGIPPGLPMIHINFSGHEVTVSSGIGPPEDHRGVNRAIRNSGMPLKAVALLTIGSKQMLIVDAKNYEFPDRDGRKQFVLVLPIELGAGIHNYTITTSPTKTLTVPMPERPNNER